MVEYDICPECVGQELCPRCMRSLRAWDENAEDAIICDHCGFTNGTEGGPRL